jgi:lipid-A-disaccharide synthase-like uncharacterized protein
VTQLDDPTCPRAGGALIPVVFLLLLAAGLAAADPAVTEHTWHGYRFEGRGLMHAVLYDGFVRVTGWKLLGYVGASLFAARWFVQAWHRRRHGDGPMPTVFWIMSLAGAGLTTMYFIWGKNDSVGILQNALPASVALYNIGLDLRRRSHP